jgi:hypothetical protein
MFYACKLYPSDQTAPMDFTQVGLKCVVHVYFWAYPKWIKPIGVTGPLFLSCQHVMFSNMPICFSEHKIRQVTYGNELSQRDFI